MSESFITHGKRFIDISIGKQASKSWKPNHYCSNSTGNVFHSKKLSKLRRLLLFWQKMIILFCRIFLLICSRVTNDIKITKFHQKTISFQNHEGSCYYYHTFWNPRILSFSSNEKNHKQRSFSVRHMGVKGVPDKKSEFWAISDILSKEVIHKKSLIWSIFTILHCFSFYCLERAKTNQYKTSEHSA